MLGEFIRRGLRPNLDLFYYRTKNLYEIDFIVHDGRAVTELSQVCHSLQEEGALPRELRAIQHARAEHKTG